MNVRLLGIGTLLAAFVAGGCRCDSDVKKINPVLRVAPMQLDYGKVKVGESSEKVVTLSGDVNASVTITGITLRDGNAPGGAAAFEVVDPPASAPALGDAPFTLRFRPTALQAYEAQLVIASNDEDRPEIILPISGEGAHPLLTVTPQCEATQQCRGTVTVDPPSIDFGEEPFQRAVQLPQNELPSVSVLNDGEVQLVVTKIAIEGADAAAFAFVGNSMLPDQLPDGTPALFLEAGTGVSLSIRFTPTSEQQQDYSAQVIIEADDPTRPQVTVPLTGKLGPNLPPQICANITRVKPPDEAEFRYDSAAEWAQLLIPPSGGYDFTQTRDIRPRSEVKFSALSSTDDRTCTSDPEDRRVGLTYLWEVTRTPPDAPNVSLIGATTPTATLAPQSTLATGEYEIRLTVSDAQNHTSVTTLKFAVVLKQDLVVQVSWNGDNNAYANVDLDVHLVRPSASGSTDPFAGAFSYFDEGPNQKTSGDMNGYAFSVYAANMSQGLDFDWGQAGTADDPRLNLDETGNGALIENVSLNYPENDPACATGDCIYKVFVHYFADKRSHNAPPACTVTGTTPCVDGAVCDCTAAGDRCVANSAPKGAAATGSGKCYAAPKPVVRIFLKSNPTPAAVIPLDTLMPADDLAIGAPCHLLYVADIVWPQKGSTTDGGTLPDGGAEPMPQVIVQGADGTGRITSPQIRRFGYRAQGGLGCSPNATRGSSSQDNWYAEEPL